MTRGDGRGFRAMKTIAGVAAAAALALMASAAFAAEPSGTWLSTTGQTKVRIAPCGGAWCGTILWVRGPEQNDVNNPDAAKHSKPLVGSVMIYNMKPDGDAYKGSLYDYTSGKTYTGKLKANGDTLELSGCVLGGLICQSENWSRAN
jgi:uncharacterized protein (DUF2147 family)